MLHRLFVGIIVLGFWAGGLILAPVQSARAASGTAPATSAASIGAGDLLQVKANDLVTPGQEYMTDAQVNELGDIKIRNVGSVHVGGLTPAQVEDKIGQLAVTGGFLPAKSANNPGPQVFVRLVKKAEAGVGGGAGVAGALPKIGVADTLLVKVYELVMPGQEYVAELQVDGEGDIKVRNLGRVAVAGLTTTEIEEKIAQQAVKTGLLMPKDAGNPGPQVVVMLLKKAAPGERPATIGAGDTLQVEVFELVAPRQLYSTKEVVSEAGDIKIQNVGIVRVGGLTPQQVEDKIAEQAVAGGFLPVKGSGHSGPMINVTWLKKPAAGTAPGVQK